MLVQLPCQWLRPAARRTKPNSMTCGRLAAHVQVCCAQGAASGQPGCCSAAAGAWRLIGCDRQQGAAAAPRFGTASEITSTLGRDHINSRQISGNSSRVLAHRAGACSLGWPLCHSSSSSRARARQAAMPFFCFANKAHLLIPGTQATLLLCVRSLHGHKC